MLAQIGPRQRWLRLLALSEVDHLERCWMAEPDKPAYSWLRPPETGLVMVRARVGGVGQQFNIGEMTITRCLLQFENGTVGAAYVAGRDHRHAELASLFDGMLQDRNRFDDVDRAVLVPIERAEEARRGRIAERAQATRVDFFAQMSS